VSEQASAIERGDISTEDAEKLAASFRPSWEMDESSTAIGPAVLSPEEMKLLTGDDSPVPDAAPAPVAAAPAPAPPAPAPAPAAPPPAPAPAVDSPAHLGKTLPLAMVSPAANLVPPQTRSAPPPPMAAPPARDPFASRPSASASAANSGEFAVPKKGNSKAIVFAAIGVGALVGVVLGIRFVTSGDDKPKATTTSAGVQTTATAREIPPPPDVPSTAQAEGAKADPPKADPPKADPPKADPPKADPPPKATAAAPKAPDPPKVAAHTPDPPKGKPTAAAPPPPPPPATQKAPPKSTPGGIVRDNPF